MLLASIDRKDTLHFTGPYILQSEEAHYEFGKKSTASIHNISNFIKLIGLDPFVASSYPKLVFFVNNYEILIFI